MDSGNQLLKKVRKKVVNVFKAMRYTHSVTFSQLLNMYHRALQVKRKQTLLEELLQVQKQIRMQREKVMQNDRNNRKKYTKIFEPLTESIQKLKTEPQPITTTNSTPLVDFEEEVKKDDGEEPENFLDDLNEIDEPGYLYTQALQEVPRGLRDDGMLGLNTNNHTIGDWMFEVAGNHLLCRKGVEAVSFEVTDLNLWCLLLVFNPKQINLSTVTSRGMLLPYVRKYAEIAIRLELRERYERISRTRNRVKYKLIRNIRLGKGFLFTSKRPTLIHPDTVIIPSDSKGLLKNLLLAVSEFRAGNTSMRNIIVPLAAEAERKNILPKDLLTNDEKIWVFA